MLVTGAGGFLGTRIVQRFSAHGARVRAVLHAGSTAPASMAAAHEQVRIELRESSELESAFRDHDLVVHAAALTRAHGPDGGRLMETVNVEMTRNVIEACRRAGVPRLVHVSSTAAIGISPDPRTPADERFTFNLGDLGLSYNVSKRNSEQLALDANGAGLEVVVVNPGFVFGWHEPRYRGGEVISRVLNTSPVVCTGGGLSMVHVDDVVAGIVQAADRGRGGERYILSGDNRSFREIADTVLRVAGVRRRILAMPDRARDLLGRVSNARARRRGAPPNLVLDGRYAYQYYSSEKAAAELGYQRRPFESIVEDFLGGGRSDAG
ncbi:MAG TPA: NAD-dependent epimerase/dehydratase family protein [Gemmatimonadaceae bacterium]|nr:NAD-dependent epimerase/dehydratase family protein [Gemmatimonadaceae bacterium]